MKKALSFSIMALLVLSVLPGVLAAGIGAGIGGDIVVEEFKPIVWQCGKRVLWDEEVQPWRVSLDEESELYERNNNYLFEGEKYQIDVLVFDKNKIDAVMVDLSLNDGEYSVNCVPRERIEDISVCNARILEEEITGWDSNVMEAYTCSFTVADSDHMYGEYDLTVEACDNDAQGGQCGTYDEVATWFLNPIISLDVGGGYLDFETEDGYAVRPGTTGYSNLNVRNYAEGGVVLDMFITGKDWQAVGSGRCMHPETRELVNYLPLEAFSYYAENGAYSTRQDMQIDNNAYSGSTQRTRDAEGYLNIHQQLNSGFEEAMFDEAEILQQNPISIGNGQYIYLANLLYPGSTGMSMTFKLELPEPCYGEYEASDLGSIYIWAEAV